MGSIIVIYNSGLQINTDLDIHKNLGLVSCICF